MKHLFILPILFFAILMFSFNPKPLHIFAIGYSKGAHENGWIDQREKIISIIHNIKT